jgi:prepilin-type N-terminal cleavage/methylation domain-containing protein
MTGEEGFTFIELLTVVMVLGALTAIALPSFIGESRKADDANAKAAITAGYHALEQFRVEHDSYSSVSMTDLAAIDPSLGGESRIVVDTTSATYRLAIGSTSGHTFVIARAGGPADRQCTPAGAGGCLDDGTW